MRLTYEQLTDEQLADIKANCLSGDVAIGTATTVLAIIETVEALAAELAAIPQDAVDAANLIAEYRTQVDTLTQQRDAITQESVANMEASIKFEAQLNAALARAESAEAERDEWRDRAERVAETRNKLNNECNRLVTDCAAAVARAESAETERDAHCEALTNMTASWRSAEARITAVEAAIRPYGALASVPTSRIRAALGEPVGEPQRPARAVPGVDFLRPDPDDAVGEPQPEPCATCGDCRWICDYDVSDEYQGCLDTRCPRNRRPCPSCVPPETP